MEFSGGRIRLSQGGSKWVSVRQSPLWIVGIINGSPFAQAPRSLLSRKIIELQYPELLKDPIAWAVRCVKCVGVLRAAVDMAKIYGHLEMIYPLQDLMYYQRPWYK